MTWVSDHKSDPNILKWRLLHLDWNDDDGNDEFFYTDCDVPIAYDGEYWEPRSFSIGSVTLSPFGASCSVVIPDSDQELFAQLALTNGAQGRTVMATGLVVEEAARGASRSSCSAVQPRFTATTP